MRLLGEAVNVDNTWTRISLTCAQQSGLEIDYKDQKGGVKSCV